ncbi:hypothetical protein [Holophaga foetida]|nr:hypothetical protein [Holophaga foetida]
MASASVLHHLDIHWFESHDRLLDWILVVLGALVGFMVYSSNPEAFWH